MAERLPRARWVLGLVLALGCPGDPADLDLPSADQQARSASQRMLGSWKHVLSPAEQHQQKVLQLALQTPRADSATLESAGLSSEERMLVEMIAMARAQDPDDPKVREMRTMLDAMDHTSLLLTPEHLTLVVGERREERRYSIMEDTAETVVLRLTNKDDAKERSASLTLSGPDALDYQESSQSSPMRFVRQSAR